MLEGRRPGENLGDRQTEQEAEWKGSLAQNINECVRKQSNVYYIRMCVSYITHYAETFDRMTQILRIRTQVHSIKIKYLKI